MSATKLDALLKSRGTKQRWLANQLGVAESTVSNWCHGLEIPEQYRAKLAALLWVKVKDVVGDVEAPGR